MQATDKTTIREFQETVWEYYHTHGRTTLPWRLPESNGSFDPYKIMLSEIMLQQTQVQRVIPKYYEFLQRFPSLSDLASVELGEVLRMWSGLGYNRRAKFLWQAALMVQNDYSGEFPQDLKRLVALPGIGANTAGAIMAYAFNSPQPFIETNVRTVLIHHFYHDQHDGIHDKELLELAIATLDHEHPREWHWALMDYGSYLKQSVGNLNRQSKTYAKQSTFEGSKRQVRGKVIAALRLRPMDITDLQKEIADDRLLDVLQGLQLEDMIRVDSRGSYSL